MKLTAVVALPYCSPSYTKGEYTLKFLPIKLATKPNNSVKSIATSCVKLQEVLHFFEHGIVIRTASRTGEAVCRCEKLLHFFRRGLARGADPGHGEIRRASTETCGSVREGREVISRQHPLLLPERRWLVLAALLLTAACGQSGGPATSTPLAGAWHAFEGTWTATGTRRTLHLGPDHRAAIFDLTGSLLLTGAQRPAVGFKAQAIGFSDSRVGMQGRCVWTDERGDMVYSELRGEAVGSGNHIVGTFVGGTGRYAGVTGDYTFQWQYVVDAEDGAVSGRVVDLKGRARLGQAAPAPAGGPGR